MGESIVQKKTARLIQQELSQILTRDLNYLPGTLLTLSVVRVPADLALAKVYISVLPGNQLEKAADTLNENAWEIRHALAKRIRNKMRKIPELRFFADDSFQEADRINDLLEKLNIPPEEKEGEESED